MKIDQSTGSLCQCTGFVKDLQMYLGKSAGASAYPRGWIRAWNSPLPRRECPGNPTRWVPRGCDGRLSSLGMSSDQITTGDRGYRFIRMSRSQLRLELELNLELGLASAFELAPLSRPGSKSLKPWVSKLRLSCRRRSRRRPHRRRTSPQHWSSASSRGRCPPYRVQSGRQRCQPCCRAGRCLQARPKIHPSPRRW